MKKNFDEVDLLRIRLAQTFLKADEYGPSLKEGPFHGPSLLETLDNVTEDEAGRKPLSGRHSIREIVNHCTFWMNEACKAIQEISLTKVDEFKDWPSDSSVSEWDQSLDRLNDIYTHLFFLVAGLNKDNLETVIESNFHGVVFRFSLRKMLYGIIDHNIYHAGQISLLKTK